MSAPLTVSLTGAQPLVQQHRAALSSIPERLREAERDTDLVLIDASSAGWAEKLEAVVQAGTHGVLVTAVGAAERPEAVRAAALVARDAGVVVVAHMPCLMNRMWQQVAPDWRRDAAAAALLDSTATTVDEDLDQILLQQLALVREILGDPDRLETADLSTTTFHIRGTAGVVRIGLSGVRARYPTLAIDLVGVERRRRAVFDGRGLATPARVSSFDRAGTRTEPLRYESPHRVGWLELHAAMDEGSSEFPRSDLEKVAENITWARRLLDVADAPPTRQKGRSLR